MHVERTEKEKKGERGDEQHHGGAAFFHHTSERTATTVNPNGTEPMHSLGGESSHGAVLVRGQEAFLRVFQFDDDQQVTDRYADERNHGVGEHREEASKDLIAMRVQGIECFAVQRAASVEDEVERDGHDIDDHDRDQ